MTIRLGCPRCGEVDLAFGDVALQPGEQGQPHTYRFDCPGCRQAVVKRADVRMLRLLKGHGLVTPPAAAGSPAPPPPPVTYDDLLDFHFQLESDEVIAVAVAHWSAELGARSARS
jgi:predicted RNA-binding Zn-ribbon protein involved in translation (DUF1610 family)